MFHRRRRLARGALETSQPAAAAAVCYSDHLRLVHSTRAELTCNKSTQLHATSASRLDWLQRNSDGFCSVSLCAVNTAIGKRVFDLEFQFANAALVQFWCCEYEQSSTNPEVVENVKRRRMERFVFLYSTRAGKP